MNVKDLLIKDKDLYASANAAVKTEWFAKYLAMARAEFMALPTMQDPANLHASAMLRGARLFEETILSLTDLPENPDWLPGTGLVHDIDAFLAHEKAKALQETVKTK
jgi:hypothetical protein